MVAVVGGICFTLAILQGENVTARNKKVNFRLLALDRKSKIFLKSKAKWLNEGIILIA